MFHSMRELWERLGVEAEHHKNRVGARKTMPWRERQLEEWFISGSYEHRPLELAARLVPIACIGRNMYTFEAPIDKKVECFQNSLFHHLFTERLCR